MDEVKARPFAPLYHKVVAETITMNYEYQQIRKFGSSDSKSPLDEAGGHPHKLFPLRPSPVGDFRSAGYGEYESQLGKGIALSVLIL